MCGEGLSPMRDWSLTLGALQDLFENSGSDGESSDGDDSPGDFSEGEWRAIMGEDPVVLDGSEGDDLPQTADPPEGLHTGSYQELSEHSDLHLHCCTGSSLSLPPQRCSRQRCTPRQVVVRLVFLPKRLIAPALCRLSQHAMLWPAAAMPLPIQQQHPSSA